MSFTEVYILVSYFTLAIGINAVLVLIGLALGGYISNCLEGWWK